MAGGSDTRNTKKGAGDLPKALREAALKNVGREFDALEAVPGGGSGGGGTFGEALSSGAETVMGGKPPSVGPSGLAGLDQMTQNIRFAEALVSEQRSLDSFTKAKVEGMLGTKVDAAIHIGKFSNEAAKELNADAFAIGKHVFFREGKFQTGSAEGIALLAHELTHTLQQGQDLSVDEAEEEAHGIEDRVKAAEEEGHELAQEQPSQGTMEGLVGGGPVAPPGSGRAPEHDREPGQTSLSPDEAEVVKMLVERTIALFREASDVDIERHGIGH